MDCVYVVGNGSLWEDNELRYSLRSLEQYGSNVDNVYIIGHLPRWVNPDSVKHYKFEEKWYKEHNIMQKIKFACKLPELSDDFLFLNDDHFFLKPVDINTIPYYRKQAELVQSIGENNKFSAYARSLRNTETALIGMNKKVYHFDVHTPIIYNKEKFIWAVERYDWFIPYAYTVKSIYCNTHDLDGPIYEDIKVDKFADSGRLRDYIKRSPFFSVGDGILSPEFSHFMEKRYPNKSKYER